MRHSAERAEGPERGEWSCFKAFALKPPIPTFPYFPALAEKQGKEPETRHDPIGITDHEPRVSRRRYVGLRPFSTSDSFGVAEHRIVRTAGQPEMQSRKCYSDRNSPFPFSCHKFCSELGLLYPEAIFRKAGRAGTGRMGRMLECATRKGHKELSNATTVKDLALHPSMMDSDKTVKDVLSEVSRIYCPLTRRVEIGAGGTQYLMPRREAGYSQ